MSQRPRRSCPSLTGTLFENTARLGPDDCWAYGFARVGGMTYRIKVYEGGHARGESAKKRWTLAFALDVNERDATE